MHWFEGALQGKLGGRGGYAKFFRDISKTTAPPTHNGKLLGLHLHLHVTNSSNSHCTERERIRETDSERDFLLVE